MTNSDSDDATLAPVFIFLAFMLFCAVMAGRQDCDRARVNGFSNCVSYAFRQNP